MSSWGCATTERQIRFTGFGGQGVVLMGIILARAAALYNTSTGDDGKTHRMFAIQTQSYGPSARGGHSKSDVKISSEDMLYPFVEIPDFLVVMSSQAYKKYVHERKPDTKIILDPDLVPDRPTGDVFQIKATKAAEEIGTRIVSNVVMLGAFREISGVVSHEALEKALLESVPKPTHDLNRTALSLGEKLGREALERKGKS